MRNFLLCLVFVSALCACGNPEDDDLNRDPVLYGEGPQTYQVACYYYDPTDPFYGESNFIFDINSSWVWATDENDTTLNVLGQFEDAFLVVESVYAQNRILPGPQRRNLTNSYAEIERYCDASIKKAYPTKKYERYKITAKKWTEYFYDYPAIFADQKSLATLPRMVIFGDSLSDNGNLKKWIKVFPEAPYFLGRFTNGPNWTDYLQKEADVAIHNWAYGGAQSEPFNDATRFEIIDYIRTAGRNVLTGSMSRYTRNYVEKYLFNQTITAADKTLFVVWIGANDYISKSDSTAAINKLADLPASEGGAYFVAERTTNAIVDHIDYLYRVGARNFLVANLPNLGIAPLVAQDTNYHKDDTSLSQEEKRYLLSTHISSAIALHNDFLKEKIAELRIKRPDIKIIEADVADALNRVVNNKHPLKEEAFDYGFDFKTLTFKLHSTTGPDIVVHNRCFAGTYLGTSDAKLTCPQIKNALFYDQVHPTTKGHCWLSFKIHRVLFDAKILTVEPDIEKYKQTCGGI